MSLSQNDRNELEDLLDDLVIGDFTAARSDRLNQLLHGNRTAQQVYLDYFGMHSALLRNALAQPTPFDLKAALAAHAEANITTKQPSVPTTIAPPASPVLRFLGGPRRSLIRPIVWSTALVAILSYGSFTIIAWNLRSGKLPSTIDSHDSIVALISDTHAVRWSQHASSKPGKSGVLLGEPLAINSGTIELELNAGTKLVIEGPAEWSIDGGNSATLRSGKLAAHVTPRAIGFTLDTPTTRIVDLGTEFGVEIANGDVTEVQVFKGKVELHPTARTSELLSGKHPITLEAGSGVRLEPNGASGKVTTRHITVTPDRFKRQVRPGDSRRLKVSGSLASSEWPACPVRHLTDGSGLRENRHSADARSTMWMTRNGDGKNAYVLFDLGSPCRIESMKIWNYNDNYLDRAFHKTRGVKQVDIYISATGDPDPLTHPEKWKLVAEDCQLSMANGKDDYDSPDIIPLGNAETRFVAIVCEEQFDSGRDQSERDKDVTVGLSEVQFFGEKVVATRTAK